MEGTEEVKPKKKRNGAYAKRKGNNYELKIIWNKQVDKGVNMGSDGEYVMMSKDFFYELIKKS